MTWPNDVITRTVTATYLTGSGDPARGRVTFTPTVRVVDENDAVVIEDTLVAPLDVNGSFEIDLPTTDNLLLSPQGWAYQVSVRLYGVRPHKFFALLPYGDGSAVDLQTDISTTASASITEAVGGYLSRGPIGPRGPGVLIGAGEPDSLIGFDGDIYINSDNGSYYGPKADGSWPYAPSFVVGTSRHIHEQATASAAWSIEHALGGLPSVMVVDSAKTVVIGEVIYNSTSSVTVEFSAPFSGYAYLT